MPSRLMRRTYNTATRKGSGPHTMNSYSFGSAIPKYTFSGTTTRATTIAATKNTKKNQNMIRRAVMQMFLY
ncbi:MAG: hypothetical protein ACRD8Z_07460 [Nitrososphaeraceae archaeon]